MQTVGGIKTLCIKMKFSTILALASDVMLIRKFISCAKRLKDSVHFKFRTTKHFQDPTRDLLDPIDEFVRWCPYLELKPLKFLHIEM